MSDAYHQLLDATIDYLQGMKARGVRYVTLSPAEATESRSPRREEGGSCVSEPVRLVTSAATLEGTPSKTAALAALREQALACGQCAHLASSRKNVVFASSVSRRAVDSERSSRTFNVAPAITGARVLLKRYGRER